MSLSNPAERPLGLFGGTFDPVHIGHLCLAHEAREQLGLDRVCWIPAGQPPLRSQPQTPATDRLAMVRLAIAGNADFFVDDSEVSRPQASYTVETLRRLRVRWGPSQPLVLLLGADAFSRFTQWHAWQEIFSLAHIGVATRPGHATGVPKGDSIDAGGTMLADSPALAAEVAARTADPAALSKSPAGSIVAFRITPLDVSATAIRARLVEHRLPRYLLAGNVLDYIERHHLYR